MNDTCRKRHRRTYLLYDIFDNIFNHAEFKNPSGNIDDNSFGVVTSARDPRIGQISAKFYW